MTIEKEKFEVYSGKEFIHISGKHVETNIVEIGIDYETQMKFGNFLHKIIEDRFY